MRRLLLLAAMALALPVTSAKGDPCFYRPRSPQHKGQWLFWSRGLQNGYGIGTGPGLGLGLYGSGGINDYGPFTGARHDEETLLHLGGQGPFTGTPDIMTLIEGTRGPGVYFHP